MSLIYRAQWNSLGLPSDLPPLSWEECCGMVLARLDMLSSKEVAQIIFLCSEGRYINVELLQAIITWCTHPSNLCTFKAIELGYTVKGLGLLMTFSHLGEEKPWSTFFEAHVRPFVLALVKDCLSRNVFSQTDFRGISIGSTISGVGYAFSGEESEEAKRVMDTLMGQFMEKCIFFDCSPAAIYNVLHGCWNVAYKNEEVLNGIATSTLTSLVSGKDFGNFAGGVLWGFSRLGIKNREMLGLLWMQIAENASSLNSSCLLYAVRGLRTHEDSCSTEIQIIVNEMLNQNRIKGMRTQALGSVMNAIECAKVPRHPEIKSGVASLAQEACQSHHLHRLKPIDVCRIIRGLGKMKIVDKYILTKLGSKIFTKDHLPHLSCRALINVFHSVGVLGYSDIFAVKLLISEMIRHDRLSRFPNREIALIVYRMFSFPVHDQNMLKALNNEIMKQERLSKFSTHDLALILYGYAAIGYANRGILCALTREISASHHECFKDGRSPHLIIQSCEVLKILDDDLICLLLNRVIKQVHSFSTRELCQVIGALKRPAANGLLDFVANNVLDFLQTVMSIILTRQHDICQTKDWMTIMPACCTLRYFNTDLMKVLAQHYWGSPDRRFFVRLLRLCSVLDYHTEEIFKHICENTIADIPCHLTTLTSEIQARAHLGRLSRDDFQQYCEKIEAVVRLENNPSHRVWWQILQGWIAVEVLGGEKIECPLTCNLVAKAKQKRLSAIVDKSSQFEDRIRHLLMKEGVNVLQDKAVLDSLQQIDILISGSPPTVVEVDGPSHFTMNKIDGVYKETGTTLFRNKLLKALGYKVLLP